MFLILYLSIFSFFFNEKLENLSNHPKKPLEVVIVGGGEAGCHTAIELAKVKELDGKPTFNITIIEKNNELLKGTSSITPGRLGQGFHYSHIGTALNYLHLTMAFMKKYPNCIVGKYFDNDHPLRRGRYVVMKTSIPNPKFVFETYKKIQKSYEDLVTLDPANKIWGEPNNFLKIIYRAPDETWISNKECCDLASIDDIKSSINLDNVAFIVETQEELLDLELYRQEVLNEISIFNNINIITGKEVTKLHHDGEQNFTLEYTNSEHQTFNIHAHIPIVCNWERSDRLIQTLEKVKKPLEQLTNRLKSIIRIKLPPNMQNSHSYFFCMGPYAMFSNLGNGFGKITYAPITNMQKISAEEQIPVEMQLFLNGDVAKSLKLSIGEQILAGAKQYLPQLRDLNTESIVDIDFGIVKTRGSENDIDIYNPLGKIGERDYGLVRVYKLNDKKAFIIENNAMKIVHGPINAQETVKIIMNSLNKNNIEIIDFF